MEDAGNLKSEGTGRIRYGWSALAFVIYAALSLLIFGRGLYHHFSTSHIGEGPDPQLMMWCLAWWPYALSHHLNPFFTHAIWAPDGFNVTWATCIPLISLIGAPLTSAFGPVVSLNILCLLGVPIAAWCAFLLCHYITSRYWPSLLGGYLFGFCPTILGQVVFGRLHSIWVFAVPLIVYVVLRRFRHDIGAGAFVFLLALLLIVQFLCSSEIFATMTIFGGFALVIAWCFGTRELRRDWLQVVKGVILGYLAAVLVLSPYLYHMLFFSHPYYGPVWNPTVLSSDLLNFVIPTPVNEIGRLGWFRTISGPFNRGLPSEAVAYLGWPLIIVVVLFAKTYRDRLVSRVLTYTLIFIFVVSLGPFLIVGGHIKPVPLPWLLMAVSVLGNAAPDRFWMYGFLVLAIITALWLCSIQIRNYFKLAIAAVIVIFLLPNFSAAYWVYPFEQPAFFRTGIYRHYLKKGETVFILPMWPRDNALAWQAETRMYFNMAGGLGPWPTKMEAWPILDAFLQPMYVPDAGAQLKKFLAAQRVSTVIVDDQSLPVWQKALSAIGTPPVNVGGVTIYKMPSSPGPLPTLADAANPFYRIRFETLMVRLNRYLQKGGQLAGLDARKLLPLDLIPKEDLVGTSISPAIRNPKHNTWAGPNFRYGMILFVFKHRIVIGELAYAPEAQKLIKKYGQYAAEVHFVQPSWAKKLSPERREEVVGSLVMSFTPERLASAAELASASLKAETSAALDDH